jgi:hypothetical protein
VTGNLPDKIQAEMTLAKALAASTLVPRDFRGQPANILLAVSMGNALGLEPAIALTGIKVIDGQPSLSAQLQAALVRRAGHKLRVTYGEGSATAVLIRKDDPGYEHKSVWTIERAARAGLTGKGAWRSYPEAMLGNRAITEVVRLAASDVLLGFAYTEEELGADPAAPGPASALGPGEAPVEAVVLCDRCGQRPADTSWPDGTGGLLPVCGPCDDLADEEQP